jgi:hypothetical protein
MNFANCQTCGCIFNGAFHARSFQEDDIKFLFKNFRCIRINEIVKMLNPNRTSSFELYLRQHMANESLYIGPSVKYPLCLSLVDQKPGRNWIGWIASGIRYLYRIPVRKKTPLWYIVAYQKVKRQGKAIYENLVLFICRTRYTQCLSDAYVGCIRWA